MPRPKDPSLQLKTIRLRKADIKTARQVARKEKGSYQVVIRDWVSKAAAAAAPR